MVAPAAGGPLDLVEPGRTGLLYDPTEKSSLRRTVATLVGDPLLRETVATQALERVRHHSWADVVDELVDVHYTGALAGAAGDDVAA